LYVTSDLEVIVRPVWIFSRHPAAGRTPSEVEGGRRPTVGSSEERASTAAGLKMRRQRLGGWGEPWVKEDILKTRWVKGKLIIELTGSKSL